MADATIIPQEKRQSLLRVAFSSGFFAAFSTALIVYLNSSFLETLIPETWVGFLYSFTYFVTLVVIQYYGRLISRFKNHNVLLASFFVQIVTLLLLALNVSPVLSVCCFVALVVGYNVTVINYDILLETLSKNEETGRVRGLFWSITNFAYVLAPVVAGVLASQYGFSMAYMVSAVVIIPSWLMIYIAYRNNGHVHYKRQPSLKTTLRRVWKDKNLRGIYIIAFVLYFFYSWMVIYTPLYLVGLGFTWDKIGQIFTVMLIPFVILEYPAGWLADKFFGEMEMLTIGLVFMGVSVLAVVAVSNFWLIMLVLFCSRIGASLVEIMRDTYFYKKVKADDLDLIDTFRNMRSLAYIAGPLVASILLGAGFALSTLFMVLSIICLVAVIVPFTIEDTK